MRPGIESTLCSSFVEALFVSGASISVFVDTEQQSTICVSGALAAQADSLQFSLGEGPRWDSFRRGVPVISPDLFAPRHDSWPAFSSAARELGIAAVFAFPMKLGAATVGVVDLYSVTARRLDVHQVSLASSMANRLASAAVHLATESAHDDHSERTDGAPALRREVHQATGMVQAQLESSATDAFARLRGYAFAHGLPIEQVAREVVARRLDFSTLSD